MKELVKLDEDLKGLIDEFNTEFGEDGFCDIDMFTDFAKRHKDKQDAMMQLMLLYAWPNLDWLLLCIVELAEDFDECKRLDKCLQFKEDHWEVYDEHCPIYAERKTEMHSKKA